jgi:hypothetical protein
MRIQWCSMPIKVLFFFLLLFTLFISLVSSNAFADDNSTISVLIDGKLQKYDQPPLIDKGYTLVPLRAIFEALGAEIQWNIATRTATATKENVEIIISVGKRTAYVNGQEQQLDVGAQIINGHTMVPLRFISQAFGAHINWRPVTKTVAIKTTIVNPETSKLKLPIKLKEPVLTEIKQDTNEIPKQEEIAPIQGPQNPPSVTPMVTVPLSDLNREWKTFKTQYFQIYYYEQEQDIFLQSQFYDEISTNLIEEFGHPLPEQIPVYFYNKADYDLESKIPAWSIAAWNGSNQSMRIRIDPSMPLEQRLMSFRHELTHAITLSSIDSVLYDEPTWFMEAVATYYEQAQPYYDLDRASVIYKAFQDKKLIAFSDIAEDNNLWSKEDAGLIYAEAQSFYGYLVEQYGLTKTNEIFYTMGKFDDVVQHITNHSLASLEKSWKANLELIYTTASITVKGKLFIEDNSWYEGEIKNGLQHGQGKYYSKGKLIYTGGFKDGKFDGQGILYFINGSIYKGNMKDGKSNGYGKYYWLEGDRYEGNFVDDQFEGQGSYFWKNGDMYVGEWKAGKRNGQGVVKTADGSTYPGLYKDDERL